jgi:hypothetical protein
LPISALAVARWIVSAIHGPSQAQQGDVEFSTYTLFDHPDDVVPKPDAMKQLADAIRMRRLAAIARSDGSELKFGSRRAGTS